MEEGPSTPWHFHLKRLSVFYKKPPLPVIVLIYFGVLTHLLYSYYFYNVGLAPFALLSSVILSCFSISGIKNYRGFLPGGTSHPLTILVFLIFSFFVSVVICSTSEYKFYINAYIGIFLDFGIFFGFIGLAINRSLQTATYKAIWLFFLISLSCFIIQTSAWYLYGVELDFLVGVTGEEQRLIGHALNVGGVVTRRASGLFAEPAIYCWVMLGVGFFLLRSLNRSVSKFFVYPLFALSLLFSFSLVGWIVGSGCIVLQLCRTKSIKSIALGLILIVVLGYLFFPYVETYWEARVLNLENDGSFNERLSVYGLISEVLVDPFYLIFGLGAATRINAPALPFWVSSVILFGAVGTFFIFKFVISFLIRMPGSYIDKGFIIFYVMALGINVTSTLNWFMLGCMSFLMIYSAINDNPLRSNVTYSNSRQKLRKAISSPAC